MVGEALQDPCADDILRPKIRCRLALEAAKYVLKSAKSNLDLVMTQSEGQEFSASEIRINLGEVVG